MFQMRLGSSTPSAGILCVTKPSLQTSINIFCQTMFDVAPETQELLPTEENTKPFLLYDDSRESNSRVIAFDSWIGLHCLELLMPVSWMATSIWHRWNFNKCLVFVSHSTISQLLVCMLYYRAKHVVEKYEGMGLELYVQTGVTDFLRAVAGVCDVNSKMCFYHLLYSKHVALDPVSRSSLTSNGNDEFRRFCGILDVHLTFYHSSYHITHIFRHNK